MALFGFLFAVSSIWARRFLDVVAPNIDLLICGLTMFVNGSAIVRGRNWDAVDICRACGTLINERLAIGFAAANVPFDMVAKAF